MRRLLFLLAIVSWSLALVNPLGAHTEVWQRSPESGLAYGGTIDRVQISFIAAVASSEITIVGPDDQPVAVGETRLEVGDRIAVVEFPPLETPGAYVVSHTELAADGDNQDAQFQFFYDPSSENEVMSLIVDDGPNWVLLGILAGVILILAGLFWPGKSGK